MPSKHRGCPATHQTSRPRSRPRGPMKSAAAAMSMACWLRISAPKMRRLGRPATPSVAGSRLRVGGQVQPGSRPQRPRRLHWQAAAARHHAPIAARLPACCCSPQRGLVKVKGVPAGGCGTTRCCCRRRGRAGGAGRRCPPLCGGCRQPGVVICSVEPCWGECKLRAPVHQECRKRATVGHPPWRSHTGAAPGGAALEQAALRRRTLHDLAVDDLDHGGGLLGGHECQLLGVDP